MYKTIWFVNNNKFETKLTYYHFGKKPQFPFWYMQKENVYEVEMIWNIKLVYTPKMFFKCLFHKYIICEKK